MSGFVIKYIDIYNLLWEYKEKLETLIENIGYCENSINDFITSTAFQGEAVVLCQDLVQVKMRNFSPF